MVVGDVATFGNRRFRYGRPFERRDLPSARQHQDTVTDGRKLFVVGAGADDGGLAFSHAADFAEDLFAGADIDAFRDSPIEIVNLRVSGIGRMPKIEKLKRPADGSLAEALVRTSPSVFRIGGELKSFDTPVYRRTSLPVGEVFNGPAIILQKDSTTVMPPATTAIVDTSGSILITLGEAE